jgi:lysine-N-methylase
MKLIAPDYYPQFRCIADKCRHSCCIGWEIDIDPDKLDRYLTLPGPLGDRLRRSISLEGEPHFILDAQERCPFLNQQGLCDLILELGEESLCGICRDHPRFRNELPGRVETGLGLCCEEAARLILGRDKPMRLVCTGTADCEDEYVALRDRAVRLLQNPMVSLQFRADSLLALLETGLPPVSMDRWAGLLLELERLEDAWTVRLEQLRDGWREELLAPFEAQMKGRQEEYSRFMVYLLYRHLANAASEADLAARGAFAVWGWQLLRALGALQYARTGAFDFEDQVELARLFSAELEYSDENLYILLDALCDA